MNINVTPDGFVDLGNNNWVSLDQIQQAVLHATNPALNAIAPEGEPRKRIGLPTVNLKKNTITAQEHLSLPSTAPAGERECGCHRMPSMNFDFISGAPHQTMNSGEEHLPLPRMVFPIANQQKASKQTANTGEQHLIPPNTMQRTK